MEKWYSISPTEISMVSFLGYPPRSPSCLTVATEARWLISSIAGRRKVRYANPLPDMGRALYENLGEGMFWSRDCESHIFLVACKGYQIALEGFVETRAKIHGAFTQALIHALESDTERTMTYQQLLGQIGALPSQTPVIHGDGYRRRLWSVGEFLSQ